MQCTRLSKTPSESERQTASEAEFSEDSVIMQSLPKMAGVSGREKELVNRELVKSISWELGIEQRKDKLSTRHTPRPRHAEKRAEN